MTSNDYPQNDYSNFYLPDKPRKRQITSDIRVTTNHQVTIYPGQYTSSFEADNPSPMQLQQVSCLGDNPFLPFGGQMTSSVHARGQRIHNYSANKPIYRFAYHMMVIIPRICAILKIQSIQASRILKIFI